MKSGKILNGFIKPKSYFGEIQTNAEKIESLYSNAIEDKTFHKNTAQFISLRKLFEQKIANCVESYSNYVRDNAFDFI